jgi:hypothetical protein
MASIQQESAFASTIRTNKTLSISKHLVKSYMAVPGKSHTSTGTFPYRRSVAPQLTMIHQMHQQMATLCPPTPPELFHADPPPTCRLEHRSEFSVCTPKPPSLRRRSALGSSFSILDRNGWAARQYPMEKAWYLARDRSLQCLLREHLVTHMGHPIRQLSQPTQWSSDSGGKANMVARFPARPKACLNALGAP